MKTWIQKIIYCLLLLLFFSLGNSCTLSYLCLPMACVETFAMQNTEDAETQVEEEALEAEEESELNNREEKVHNEYETDSVSSADIISSEDIISANELLSGNSAETKEADTNETFSKDDWNLILVNKQHFIPDDYSFEKGKIPTQKGTMSCDARIVPNLSKMIEAAKKDGINLVICSPFRDGKRQTYLFERKMQAYLKQGLSYMDAYNETAYVVTIPGSSEHQIGLALDIVCDTYYSLNEGFGETAAGKWLAKHGREYGFILRYPEGKEKITGITYEPWHYRYVGVKAAEYIEENQLTLEEFVGSLEE